jgi:flavodoxin I
MKTLVVYDSVHGNTEKIAKSIADAIAGGTEMVRANSFSAEGLAGVDLLVVGSPTHGGRPTPTMQESLARLSTSSLKGIKIAAFDTRMASRFARMFGFAADRISDDLAGKGASVAASPEGFIVKGRVGPLKEGELERAAAWAKGLIK